MFRHLFRINIATVSGKRLIFTSINKLSSEQKKIQNPVATPLWSWRKKCLTAYDLKLNPCWFNHSVLTPPHLSLPSFNRQSALPLRKISPFLYFRVLWCIQCCKANLTGRKGEMKVTVNSYFHYKDLQFKTALSDTSRVHCFLTEKRIYRDSWPHSSGFLPRSVQLHGLEAHSPEAPDLDSPWFQSPPALFWTCSSTGSLTYSNIHSVTRGHRSKETIGILSCWSTGLRDKISTVHIFYNAIIWLLRYNSRSHRSHSPSIHFLSSPTKRPRRK